MALPPCTLLTLEKVSPSHFSSRPLFRCSATIQLSNAEKSREVAIPPSSLAVGLIGGP